MQNGKKIDKSKQTPMMQQYLSVKEQYNDMLLFYRLGDFYELFFDDAIKASKLLEITLTSRGGNTEIPMCGVPYHAAHAYIQKLVDFGEKVAIAEQTSEPTKGKALVTREVTKIITPGTFVQEGSFEADTNCYVAACRFNDSSYELAYGDISIGKYYYISDIKDQTALIDALRIIRPLELVFLTIQDNYFAEICEQLGILTTKTEQIIETTNPAIEIKGLKIFSLLENYLLSVRSDSMLSFQSFEAVTYESYMYMSAATSASLELFETIKNRNKQGSLYSLLDQTKSAVGARLLRHWLGQPLVNQVAITERLDIVDYLHEQYLLRVSIQKAIDDTYDIERLISRISAQTAGPRELHQLKQTLLAVNTLENIITNEAKNSLLKEKWQKIGAYQPVLDTLISALAIEDITSLKNTGLFNQGYSPELDELQEIANGGTQWLLDLEQKEKERTGIKTLRIKYNKVFGYFIEISKGQVPLVQDEWGYHRKQTLTNAERYITDELKVKEEQILGAKERLEQLEKQLFFELCEKITPFRLVLQKLADYIAWLDVLQSFAQISQEYKYVRPLTNSTQEIKIKMSRHPIIEQVVGEHFIANDVEMIEHDVLLITGPNMAGKSTYMRQVALCAILHQIGCFVPANQAELPIFDAIYTRIGAQDDLFAGESTFMVEMKEVSQALSQATANSLLLFDEIGRGTATYDGLALAYAILEHIEKYLHAKTLFSTHYHELTEFAGNMSSVSNIHVSATLDGDNIIFHHHISSGSVERSYGVQVAKLAQLPESVIEEAKRILIVLEANHVQVDKSLIESEYVNAVIDLQTTIDNKQQQIMQYQKTLTEIIAVDIDDLSPKQALETLYELQKGIKSML